MLSTFVDMAFTIKPDFHLAHSLAWIVHICSAFDDNNWRPLL